LPDRGVSEEALEDLAAALEDLAEAAQRQANREADEAAGITRRPMATERVKSLGGPLSMGPRLDPAAPKAESRSRRGGGAPVSSDGLPIAEPERWLKGQVLTFHPRTWQGSVRAHDGKEYPIAASCLMNSGLTTLVIGMRCEFRVTAGECDKIRAAWH
jgi:hypothetical protein